MKLRGWLFEPTGFHVRGPQHEADDGSFGPIIGIQKVSSDREALDLMNDTSYGLQPLFIVAMGTGLEV